ncbi:MAG: chemotaxis protein CheA [Magnetococcales bacterium]|nr:chemotaxis protein CheA [Magnetococcales bacterium]
MVAIQAGEVQQLFLQEMEEILQQMEEDMLFLEANPSDMERLHALFRSFHTLKGGAGLSGLTRLSQYTHKAENVLDGARSGKLPLSSALVSALLEALDCLKAFMEEAHGRGRVEEGRVQASLGKFAQLAGAGALPSPGPAPAPVAPPPAAVAVPTAPPAIPLRTFTVRLRFNADLLTSGTDPLVLIQDLEALGSILVFSHPHAVPPLEQLEPRRLHLWWTVLLKTTAPQKKLQNILMFFLDGHDVRIQQIEGGPDEILDQLAIDSHVTDPSRRRLVGQPEEGPAPVAAPPAAVASPPPAVAAPPSSPAVAAVALPPVGRQGAPPVAKGNSPEGGAKKTVDVSLRVNIQKLDALINLIGEMILVHTRLRQSYESLALLDEESGGQLGLGENLGQIVDDHDRIVQELHVQAMKVRMVPVGNVLFPLKRLVRDYCEQSGKQMQLHILGDETEVDKTIVEKLNGPLTHLVRNAMDHGVEMPELRRQQGKNPEGRLSLQVANRKNSILIELTDDGAGVNYERVLAIARERGLIAEEERPGKAAILQFLFHSGFSTAKEVTEISGRGVGMDVVRKEIESLRGSIHIESTMGKGTLFRIELPLTLAVIEGLLVGVGGRIFVVPLLSIVETLQPRFCQFEHLKERGELVKIRHQYLPLLRLHQIFSIERAMTDPEQGLLIIVEESGHRSCLLVDEIVDQHQVVIKNLEQNLMQVDGVAGATILGDGRVSLVLDIPGLTRHATPGV